MRCNSLTVLNPCPSNAGNTLADGIFRIPVTLKDIEALKHYVPIVLDIEPGYLPTLLVTQTDEPVWPAGYRLELWSNHPLLHTLNPELINEIEWTRETLFSVERTLELTEVLHESGILKRITVCRGGAQSPGLIIDSGRLQDQCGWFDAQANGLSAILLADRLLRSQSRLITSGEVSALRRKPVPDI